MSGKELISVIVPVYNVEKYLDTCLDSIVNQTYSNIEIILINDGSTDKSENICFKYLQTDNRIRYYSQKNSGIAVTRNFGISVATGKYITFVDSDDCVTPDFISVLYNGILQTNCRIVQCSLTTFSDDPQLECQLSNAYETITSVEYLKRSDISGSSTLWSKIYHRDLFNDIEFPIGRIHEDTAVIYKLIDKCDKIAITNDKLYCYRFNPLGITKKKIDVDRIDVIDTIYEQAIYFKERGYTDLYVEAANDIVKNFSYFFSLKKDSFVDVKSFEKHLLNKYISIRDEILKMPLKKRFRILIVTSKKSMLGLKLYTKAKKLLKKLIRRNISE